MESRVPPKYIPFEASKADLLPFELDLLPFLYPLANSLKRELAPTLQQGLSLFIRLPRVRQLLHYLLHLVGSDRPQNPTLGWREPFVRRMWHEALHALLPLEGEIH
jgi:hypothetical protein